MKAARELLDAPTERFQPDEAYKAKNKSHYELNQQGMAFCVGLVALLLPLILFSAGITGTCFYNSISHYYYSRIFGDIFVGALVFIGAFLLAYRGETKSENRLASLAGLCAIAVALIPTEGDGCDDLSTFAGRPLVSLTRGDDSVFTFAPASSDYFSLFPHADFWHLGAAASLFAFLAYYCFRVFTRVIPSEQTENGDLTDVKRARNRLYRTSGTVIVVSMVTLALGFAVRRFTSIDISWWDRFNATFWLEAAALIAFGLSWMTKGRFAGFALLDDRDLDMRGKIQALA